MDGGAQPPDAEMAEAGAGAAAAGQGAMENIQATLSHGGRFIQYNIFGNVFEVTVKYKPPILPIGKGAYGIVWYAPSPSSPSSIPSRPIRPPTAPD
jgi:mitogen-activated protein kinase 6